jgi:phage baseplate assembly protein gpV
MATTISPPVSQLAVTPAQFNASDMAQWLQSLKQFSADLRCATAAFAAEDMDHVTQTVKVQIALQERVQTATGLQWWDVQPIVMVPVIVPRGGGVALTFPVKKGDEGLLVFCDTCLDNWWQYGQTNASPAQNLPSGVPASGSQTQNEVRRHHVHDCGFIPGFCSQPNVLTDYSMTSAQLRTDDGAVIVDVAETGVTIMAADGATTVQATAAGVAIAAPQVTITATGDVGITAASFTGISSGGTALPLVNDTWFQWWKTYIFPFLQGLGYAGPSIPAGSETTVMKGE